MISISRQLEDIRLGEQTAANSYTGTTAHLAQKGTYRGLPKVGKFRGFHHWNRMQARYVAMRLDGMSHSLAEMLAIQQPPNEIRDDHHK